jgi:hypothetical protein
MVQAYSGDLRGRVIKAAAKMRPRATWARIWR